MSPSLRERWRRLWQPIHKFLLAMDSSGWDDIHERLRRLEAASLKSADKASPSPVPPAEMRP